MKDEIKILADHLAEMPSSGLHAIGGNNAPLFTIDLIIFGALKRTLSLGHGLLSMVEAKNMACARALLRMQIDTVSRLLAYTYVDDPDEVATKIIGGKKLSQFKSKDGKPLRDGYLIDRMTEKHSWVRRVYDSTSGDVHFSEKQFISSISSMSEDGSGARVSLSISQFDTNYPDSSWEEVVACFSELCVILNNLFAQHAEAKAANK